PATCEALVRGGRHPDEPAALIQWATTSQQRSVSGTLSDLPAIAAHAGVGAPATLVVGRVVEVAQEAGGLARRPSLEWAVPRPAGGAAPWPKPRSTSARTDR